MAALFQDRFNACSIFLFKTKLCPNEIHDHHYIFSIINPATVTSMILSGIANSRRFKGKTCRLYRAIHIIKNAVSHERNIAFMKENFEADPGLLMGAF
jgi:hypothetical protein